MHETGIFEFQYNAKVSQAGTFLKTVSNWSEAIVGDLQAHKFGTTRIKVTRNEKVKQVQMSQVQRERVLKDDNFERWLLEHIPAQRRNEVRFVWKQGWRSQLAWLTRNLLNRRHDGTAKVGYRTAEDRGDELHRSFMQLREDGFKINDVTSFKTSHVVSLLNRWQSEGLASSTINTRLSKLRVFASAIGKAGMIPPVPDLDRIGINPAIAGRSAVAREDKSLEGASVDPESVLKKAESLDLRFGLILRLQHQFGLRKKEAIMFQPYQNDHDTEIVVVNGTKGGRARATPVETSEQRNVLDRCKLVLQNEKDSMSGRARTLKEAMHWYEALAKKLGATKSGDIGRNLHALRHGYVHAELQKRGVPVGVKLLTAADRQAAMPKNSEERQARMQARREVAENVGHSRVSVTPAYAGAFIRSRSPSVTESTVGELIEQTD